MKIEFDPAKDSRNRKKHGLSLEFAEELDWDAMVMEPDDSQDYGEERWLGTALIFVGAALVTIAVAYTHFLGASPAVATVGVGVGQLQGSVGVELQGRLIHAPPPR